MKTLYATDLDGTLLNEKAELSESTASMLQHLLDRGTLITFVTARTPATVEPILAPMRPIYPGVAMTGASIWNPAKRMYDAVHYHNPDDVTIIDEICHQHDVTPFVYTMPQGTNSLIVYHEASHLTPIEKHFVDDRTISELKTFHLNCRFKEDDKKCTVLFFAIGDPDKIRATAEDIRKHTDCYASWYPDTYNPGLSLLEVFASGVSKANGLNDLKKMLRADRVIAFGDNLNDIPMLKAADIGVAVENAHDEVKAVADVIIGPNTADAVPLFIKEMEEKGQ